ncbi:hypothetical protein AYI69_g10526 [Smittium culicis]|uniref:Uncharacterized protein n=1 Tax=Smittium culicis TaxID=133412 RepID=A0A1R1X563_9FUNG|nr:hypothetical protein AYI69_g10526 [Smittium culicis]
MDVSEGEALTALGLNSGQVGLNFQKLGDFELVLDRHFVDHASLLVAVVRGASEQRPGHIVDDKGAKFALAPSQPVVQERALLVAVAPERPAHKRPPRKRAAFACRLLRDFAC